MTSNKRPLRPKMNEYVFQWSAKFSFAMFVVGASITPLIIEFTPLQYPFYKVFILALLGGFVFGGVAAAWALNDRADRFDDIFIATQPNEPIAEIKPKPESKPVREHHIFFKLDNGQEGVRIWQPRPASFSSWLGQVVNKNNKVQFSENQAKMREWPIERYNVLVAQLRQIGLLHNHDMHNNAPVLTEHGRIRAKEWLAKNV